MAGKGVRRSSEARRPLRDEDFTKLLRLRSGLRRFVRWSEDQAVAAGLTPAQHQLLLAVRGHGVGAGPTVGELADYLQLRHHSAVELIDRAQAAGLVARARDEADHRIVRLQLTKKGVARLEQLTLAHLEELSRLAPHMRSLWDGLDHSDR
ncbi:MAG TPA: MarR family transcriptional regulator [Actinomycetota bacterium]|nr:MarR family transcriptional regulator [Actinomycetota bacterium]